MTFSVFAAICILGCDLLIYFLFQWTLGEKGRRNRRRGRKHGLSHGQVTELQIARGSRHYGAERTKTVPYRKIPAPTRLLVGDGREAPDQVTEEEAHPRRVAAFAVAK
jgi:hypothetical protein